MRELDHTRFTAKMVSVDHSMLWHLRNIFSSVKKVYSKTIFMAFLPQMWFWVYNIYMVIFIISEHFSRANGNV